MDVARWHPPLTLSALGRATRPKDSAERDEQSLTADTTAGSSATIGQEPPLYRNPHPPLPSMNARLSEPLILRLGISLPMCRQRIIGTSMSSRRTDPHEATHEGPRQSSPQ